MNLKSGLIDLPVTLGTVFYWAHVVPLNLVCCSSMALATLICYIKSHAQRLLMRLSIRLGTREVRRVVKS